MSIKGNVAEATQNVAQTLYSFLHEEQGTQGQKKIYLVTIEGDRVDIENLSAQDIYTIIARAEAGQ